MRKYDMATATARRHIENALRARLRIRAGAAGDIVASYMNGMAIHDIRRDMRGCVALAASKDRWVSIYAPGDDGLYDHVVSLDVPAEHRERWETGSLEDAYALPAHVTIRGADAYLDPDLDAPVAQDDLTPEEAMDAVMGPVPAPFAWYDGTVDAVRVDAADGIAVITATIAGIARELIMIPLFGTAEDVAAHARERIGVPSRLCIEQAGHARTPNGEPSTVDTLELSMPGRHALPMAA
jgi:hypothetical protein